MRTYPRRVGKKLKGKKCVFLSNFVSTDIVPDTVNLFVTQIVHFQKPEISETPVNGYITSHFVEWNRNWLQHL